MLREADVFFINGLGLDDEYTKKMKNSCGNAKLDYVQLGQKIPKEQLIALGKAIKHGDHEHRGYDPHIWLGISEAIEMVQAELRYGRNDQLRRLSQEIIVTQQQEIVAMRLALGQPLPPPAPAPDQVAPAEQNQSNSSRFAP